MWIDIRTHPYTMRLIVKIDGKNNDVVYAFNEDTGEADVCYQDVNGNLVADPNSPNGSRLIRIKGKIELSIRPGAIAPGETEASMLEEIRKAARQIAGIPEPVKTGLCRCATECEWGEDHYRLDHHPQCPVIKLPDRPISSALSVVQDYPRFRRCVVAMETPAQPSPPDVAYNAMFDSGAAQRRFMEEVPFKNLFKCEREVKTECAYKFGIEKSGIPYIDHDKPPVRTGRLRAGIDPAKGKDETVIQSWLVTEKHVYVVDINSPEDVALFISDPKVWNALKVQMENMRERLEREIRAHIMGKE